MMYTVRLAYAIVIVGLIAGIIAGCAVDPIEDLSHKIESPNSTVRQQAIVDLTNLSNSRTVELLTDALSVDKELCDQAAVALVKLGRQVEVTEKDNPVVTKVSEVLENTYISEQFRARAAWTLGEIGDRRAISLLEEVAFYSFADATKPVLIEQATQALEKLGFTSEGRAYELSMGTLQDGLEVIPAIEPLPPTV